MQGNKTPMIIGLVAVIVLAVGIVIWQFSGSRSGGGNANQLEGVANTQSQGPPGSFTPAPR